MERLQTAIQLAAEIREDSWDEEKGGYKISLEEAAEQAATAVGFDTRGDLPIYLLLKYCWKDILDWANKK